MIRIRTSEINNFVGENVEICGWVEDKRELSKVIFITVRDGYGKVQVTVRRNTSLWEAADKLPRQSAVLVRGRLDRYGGVIELIPEKIEVVGLAKHPLPLDPSGRVPAGLSTILDSRALSLRIPEIQAIFRLRSKVTNLIRKFFSEVKDCVEVHTPKIIASGTEGGADLFSFKYFDQTAFLAQSPQLYKEQLMLGLRCVYEIAPYFRAEKSHTSRHLNEFISIDFEMAFTDYFGVMEVLEELINFILKNIREIGKEEFNILKYRPPNPPGKIPIFTYDDILNRLSKIGKHVEWGEDIPGEMLLELADIASGFYYIINWPWRAKPFYIKRRGEHSESFDLMYRNIELSSGGTRENIREELEMNLMEKGLDLDAFEYHLKFFDYGMPPHAGFGLGLDRLMLVISGKKNIREVVLYPRDPDRLMP